MITTAADSTSIRTKALRDADTTGQPHSLDRYLIESVESGGLLAVVDTTSHRTYWRRPCIGTVARTSTAW
jgi:hypothetical protein